jgi:cysteine desulfurase/selenocysteine lyase
MRSFALDDIRKEFPILAQEMNGYPLAYLDNAATSQKPLSVIERLTDFYKESNANINRGSHTLANQANEMYAEARSEVAAFLGAEKDEIVFVRSATEGINLIAQGLSSFIKEGDIIALTEMEHNSNVIPWQLLAESVGAEISWVSLNDRGELCEDSLHDVLSQGPRILAITHISNVLGTINPLKDIIQKAHRENIKVVVDGTQAVAHISVDVKDLDADFYVFTGHKLYGPTGVGVFYGKGEELAKLQVNQGGGGVAQNIAKEKLEFFPPPLCFEYGTPATADVIALAEAVRWVKGVGLDKIAAHEKDIARFAEEEMRSMDGLRLFADARKREAILSFEVEGVHSHDVSEFLDRYGVACRSGKHCAHILLDSLGVHSLTRASFAVYNTKEEVARMIEAIRECQEVFA